MNRKISSIKEALNFVGIKGLKNILYSYGAIKTMNTKFGNIEEVWEHCYKTAKYASKIARLKKNEKNSDDYFTAGLLHDIGKIVLMSFDKDKEKKIVHFCVNKGLETSLIEDMIMGLNHAALGGIIAKHWDFPENLVNAIMYHHDPYLALNNKDIVNAVHLANEFARVKNFSDMNFYSIDPTVRTYYNITDQKILNNIFDDITGS